MPIIAAIDFSQPSSNVARVAARFAQRMGDKLLLVHAVEPSVMTSGSAVPIPVPVGIPMDVTPLLHAAEDALHRLSEELATNGLVIDWRVALGTADRVIEELVAETNAALVVAGTHGRGAVGRLLIGSVAQRLLLRAPCPVLVLRPSTGQALEAWLSGRGPLRVVVGVDRKGHATDAALEWMKLLGKLGPCEVTLVHEYWPPGEYARLGMRGARDYFEDDPEVAAILERELDAKLGDFRRVSRASLGVHAAWGPIGEALAREAAAVDADLVVVGTDQPHGWLRVKRGSAAVSALHAIPMPLLCVPARAHVEAHASAVMPARPSIAPPLRSVLAATDLSEDGNAAVMHAFSLLRAVGGVVHLCYVAEGPLPSPAYAYTAPGHALTAARRSEVEKELRALVPPEAADLGIEARVSIVDGGEPAEQIVATALQLGAQTIVISSHGRSGVKRAVLGSVAEAVLRRAEVPVYVTRRETANVR